MEAQDLGGIGSPAAGAVIRKRVLDASASFLGLVLLAPLLACIAVAIKLGDGGPVLFRQFRVGRGGRPFRIVKFRTMVTSAERLGPQLTVAGDARVTKIGALLRRAKLDELPQLFNVLVGDMSLVGPRPEVPELITHYTAEQRAVLLSLRPGVTDYASILLRDESALLRRSTDPATFYRRCLMPIKYDLCVRYIEDIGVTTDLWIVFATLWSGFFGGTADRMIDRWLAQSALADAWSAGTSSAVRVTGGASSESASRRRLPEI